MNPSLLWHHMTARHTRGYSIHSPYLFDLANSILTDKNAYYCFSQIEASSPSCARANNKEVLSLSATHNRLLFKLALYVQARQMVEVGNDRGQTTAYLQATHSDSQVQVYDDRPTSQPWDMAVLHADLTPAQQLQAADVLIHSAHDRSLMVIDGIRRSNAYWTAWQSLCADSFVTASMDLGTMGLVFFDKHFEKKTYRIRL